MEKTNMTTCVLVAFGAFLWLVPSVGAQVDCDKDQPGALQKAIDKANSRATILKWNLS